MRNTPITIGSRGDGQPYLTLSLGIKKAGCEVTLATHRTYGTVLRERGIDFSPDEGDFGKLIESGEAQNIFETGRNSLLFSRRFIAGGEPSISIPVFGDQFFWGQRIADLGADPPPIPRKNLTSSALAETIRAVREDENRRNLAAAVGVQIRAEKGVSQALELFERYVTCVGDR